MDAETLTGKVLGTCTLEKLIGRGGMGAVFLAQQSRPRRQVAVKVLLPMVTLEPYQQAAFLERFRRETDAVGLLAHPNIVPIHEYGEQDGIAYLVMPYISGGTLRDELEREGKLSLTQTVSYLEQMSAALNFAHERGVIHRDIKPANILLTPGKRLVLTDFGLVKIITDEQQQETPLSGPGMPMGTPDYMSPEQVVGREIDARADLYSLGVILYQMVTGVVPFTGDVPMKVALQHLDTSPPPPRSHRPDLPSSAEGVILQSLAKKPEDRYACTRDLASAFRQALEAAGVVLADAPGNTASIRTVKKDQSMSKRQRGLFDPVWRGHESQQTHNQVQSPKQEDEMESQPTNELPGQYQALSTQPARDAIVGPNTSVRKEGSKALSYAPIRLRAGSKTTLLSEERADSANKPQNPNAPQAEGQAPSLSPAGSGMLNPTGKVGLLRSFGTNPPLNGGAQGPTTANASPGTANLPNVANMSNSTRQLNPPPTGQSVADGQGTTGFAPMGTTGTFNTTQQNSYQPEATNSFNLNGDNIYKPAPGTTGMLRTQTGALIPVNPLGATGSFMIPTGNESTGQTGMLKLTQPVKVVKVPVAGQPGQYVTGLLPVVQSPNQENGRSGQQSGDMFHKGRKPKHITALMLIAAVVVLIFGSVILLVMRSSGSNQNLATNSQTNKNATVAVQASATAQANLIVSDPLTSNTHGWPAAQNDTGVYAFQNGAYHIKATSDKNDAVALLPSPPVSNQFVYSITLNEVNGQDDSTDANRVNSFGLLFRLYQPDDKHLSYYAFLINPNKANPTYEFQKYDSFHDGDPRTQLWTGKVGGEYHLKHGENDPIKISANGSHFTFNVNGKDVVSKDDGGLTAGQIGMIVNLKDTEIAFSNLLVTYH